jgi:hypothetical protein
LPSVIIVDNGELHVLALINGLQPGINLAWAAALRGVAGNILKVGFLAAAGAFCRRLGCGNGVFAITAAPIGHVALGSDIPDNFP